MPRQRPPLQQVVGHAQTMSSIMVMTTGKFRPLPVVEDRQLVGIVSIVKRRVLEIELESATLRDYIRTV